MRSSLTLVYTIIVFCVQIISLAVAGLLVYLLLHLELLDQIGSLQQSVGFALLFIVLVSLVVGFFLTLLTQRISLNPFHKIITCINRLARGDFKARLSFGLFGRQPAFIELSDSFNTMAQELENTELLRGDFINNFSHEFKTPIVSIAGFAKLLRRGNLTPQQYEEYLAIIEEESLRLSAMATNVLQLTKIENQSILSNVTEYNLSEQIRSCVLLLEAQWSRKHLTFELEFDEYTICANEELLKQLWINLLDNAVKFSPTTGEIVLRITEQGKNLLITVTNFGSDIPADKLEKIWNKFYQADESHSSKGNGVGLAIVKQVVQLHHGTVRAESGNGSTTFFITLPKKQ